MAGYVVTMDPITAHAEGAVVRVRVVPGASRSEIKGRHGDMIRIRVTAPPEGGRANRAVVDLLSQATGGRAAMIVGGATSRVKLVLIRGIDAGDVARVLLQ